MLIPRDPNMLVNVLGKITIDNMIPQAAARMYFQRVLKSFLIHQHMQKISVVAKAYGRKKLSVSAPTRAVTPISI